MSHTQNLKETNDFLTTDAGTTLLQLVARGSAVIAEMFRLSQNIPSVFVSRDSHEAVKYKPILFDYTYLRNSESYEAKIDNDEQLRDLDEEFRENHLYVLERFYKLFESIHRFSVDVNLYINNVLEGIFLQHTIEMLLNDVYGRQLLAEAIFLYGVMLLTMDSRLPGRARELMVISFYRYQGDVIAETIRSVIKLTRVTGFLPGQKKRPKHYPEVLFARYPINKEVTEMVIGRLQNSDIYNQGLHYPSPKDRSTMLATQAAMLYVMLYFTPNVLDSQRALMREIVDKHFPDNWVISIYMGLTADVSVSWDSYKAAKKAIKNTMMKENVAKVTNRYTQSIAPLIKQVEARLVDGVMDEYFVMDNIQPLLKDLRDFNSALRWVMLHMHYSEGSRESIDSKSRQQQILLFIMKIAQYEWKVKEIVSKLLKEKDERWAYYKRECHGRMVELSEYFSGDKPLTRVKKDVALQKWFQKLASTIESLRHQNSTIAGRKIMRLINALKDVQDFHQIDESLQIKQFLGDTKEFLTKMIRTVHVKEDLLSTINVVSDFSYAWEMMSDYVGLMQSYIKADPAIVLLLRATFLKMVSILDQPLVRISQCNSPDLVSVSDFYSSELVKFVRTVLDIIPVTVFDMLQDIVVLTSTKLTELPMKLERTLLKEYTQLDSRFELARTTHRVSFFTEGVLNMKVTLLGVIEVQPTELLDSGIRKELVRRVATALHQILRFPAKRSDFEQRLTKMENKLEAFKRSFEYIQDYLKVNGLKIWQEEFSRIINYSVEQEENRYLRKKVFDYQSLYQSDEIPIPRFAPYDNNSETFMGRIMNELLKKTSPQSTIYVNARQAWCGSNGHEVIRIRTFELLLKGLGIVGITGLDKLVGFMLVSDLTNFAKWYRRNVTAKNETLQQFLNMVQKKMGATNTLMTDARKDYSAAFGKLHRYWGFFKDWILSVGQKQLIRRQISFCLNFSAKIQSKLLYCALEAADAALLNDIRAHYRSPDKPYPDEDNPVLGDLTEFLVTCGLSNPLEKIYITTDQLVSLPLMIFLFVLWCLEKMEWNPKMTTLSSMHASRDGLDGAVLVTGCLTLLKQFHPSLTEEFLAYMGQYVRSVIHEESGGKDPSIKTARNALHFLEMMCAFGHITRGEVEAYLPAYIFDKYPQ